jgi:hypothetical protein
LIEKWYNPIVTKKIVLWTAFGVLTVGALVFTMLNDFVGKKDEMTSSVSSVLSKYWWFLLLAVAVMIAYYLCRAATYAVMMRSFTGKMRLGLCMSVTVVGNFYDNVTPLGTGGQPFQIHRLQNTGLPKGAAIAMPIMEYVISRFVFVAISIAAIILNAAQAFGDNIPINTAIYVAAAIGIVANFAFPLLLIISLISKRACRKVTRWAVITAKFFRLTKDPGRLYKKILTNLNANIGCIKILAKKKQLLLCIALSIGATLAFASVGYFVIKAFGFWTVLGLGWIEIVVLVILIKNSVTLIPTPGNSGAADLSFYWVFSSALLFSTGVASGAVATLIWRIISYYLPVLIGFIHVVSIRKRRLAV